MAEAEVARPRRTSSGAASAHLVVKEKERPAEAPRYADDESADTESSSSVAVEEATDMLASCLSSPDPTDVAEALKALEALVTRHRTPPAHPSASPAPRCANASSVNRPFIRITAGRAHLARLRHI